MTLPSRNKNELQAVRVEIARRGWKVGDLAVKAGLNPEHLSNLLCGNVSSAIAKAKVNDALGQPLFVIPPSPRTMRPTTAPYRQPHTILSNED